MVNTKDSTLLRLDNHTEVLGEVDHGLFTEDLAFADQHYELFLVLQTVKLVLAHHLLYYLALTTLYYVEVFCVPVEIEGPLLLNSEHIHVN